jgi:N-acetylglucosaminyl-diphospho-decaprenol L-rhamnosyltransferase
MASIAFVIVTHNSNDAVARTLPALGDQLASGDELIVVDNASSDGTVETVRQLVPSARVVETGANLGYGAGNNRGAAAASAELLCFLNPDAMPSPGFREAISRPVDEGREWRAWQGLVTADGGGTVNTRGGVIHFTGIAWAGGAGEPLDPAMDVASTSDPAFLSGACLAIGRERFLELGGFVEEFFLYHEDVDLSLRLRLLGGRLGLEPGARVDHDYEFEKGPAKWRQLERNRWATLIRTYPGELLALLAPGLLATELALVPIAVTDGWFRQKALAWIDTLGSLRRLIGERRTVQAARTITAKEFARALTPELDSPYLGGIARSGLVRASLRLYWRLVLALLSRGRA